MTDPNTPATTGLDDDDLPPIGMATSADHTKFANKRTRVATESRNERNKWLPIRDACICLFNYGEYPQPADSKHVNNFIQNDVIGDKDVMFREPVAIEVGIEEDGSGTLAYFWNGPANAGIPQPVTDQAGQPMADGTGAPAMALASPQQLAVPPDGIDSQSGERIAQPIDEVTAQRLLASGVPQQWLVPIDNKALSDIYQLAFDSYARKCFLEEWIDQFVMTVLKGGWDTGLYQWDAEEGHVLFRIPVQNSFPDPTRQFVWTWEQAEIHWVLRLGVARKLFPQYADLWQDPNNSKLGQAKRVDSQTEMGYQYDRDFQTRTVTLSITWLKDQPKPMTPEEAVAAGKVRAIQVPDIAAEAPDAGRPQGADAGDFTSDDPQSVHLGFTSEGAATDQPGSEAGGAPPSLSGGGSVLQPPAPPVRTAYVLLDATNTEVTPPAPGSPVDPQWPTRLTLRRYIMLDETLIEDDECPWPSIEIIHATCIPFEDTPFGFGLPWKMRHAQKADSVMASSIAKNCEFYGNPPSWMHQAVKDRLQNEIKTAFIDPGISLGLTSSEFSANGQPLAGFIELPELNQHNIEGRQQMQSDRKELGGYTDAVRGLPVTNDPSGELQKVTMQAASGVIASISKHLQGSIRHLAGLMTYSLTHYASVDQIYRCCKKYRREVLAAIHLTLAPDAQWKNEVSLASGAGQIKEANRQRLLALNQSVDPASGAPLADAESVQEAHDLDPQTVQQRNLNAIQQRMALMPPEEQQSPPGNKGKSKNGKPSSNGNGHRSRMGGE